MKAVIHEKSVLSSQNIDGGNYLAILGIKNVKDVMYYSRPLCKENKLLFLFEENESVES